jgi:hypothetical protein
VLIKVEKPSVVNVLRTMADDKPLVLFNHIALEGEGTEIHLLANLSYVSSMSSVGTKPKGIHEADSCAC